jgi:zinc transporter 2
MVSLAFVSAGLAYEAIKRLIDPPADGVDGTIMTMIAGIGVLVNVILAWVLGENHVHLPGGHDHSHDHGHGGGEEGGGHSHGHAHDTESYGHKIHDGKEMEAKYGHDHSKDNDHHNDSHNHHSHDHDHADNKCGGHSHSHHDHADEGTPLVHDDHHNDDDSHDHSSRHHEDKRNVNLRAAYLHVMADLAQSIAVFIGGIFIWWKPDWYMIDPILTLGFCILVLYNTLGVLRSSIQVLLEEIPPSVDWQKVFDAISKVPNVEDVHDLHIWCISHGQAALSLHCTSSDPNAIYNINRVCIRFGIKHSTIQVQTQPGPCPTCTSPDICCTSHLSNRHSSSV